MSMEEFHEIFFEEADELIEAMEAELLEMVFDAENPDRINNVFRAAHSIKGGAATFGFTEITDTTHVMETLMNCVRDGDIKVTRDLIDLLLSTVDCVKDMLGSAKRGAAADADRAAQAKAALEAYLNGGAGGRGAAEAPAGEAPAAEAPAAEAPVAEASVTEAGARASGAMRHYVIEFKPSHELFRSGNDPLHIFRALRELGELQVEVHEDTVPGPADFEVDKLYLTWTLRLHTQVDPEAVLEVFDWVEDISEIDLQESGLEAGCSAGTDTDALSPDPAAAGPAAASPAPRPDNRSNVAESASIRVGIDKIDTLINLVGELVITQSMLSEMGEHIETCDLEKLRDGFAQLERHTRELQENVMKIRMVPISSVFNRLPRTVHDLTARLGKKLDLVVRGEHTELDKTVMERIGDPLVHLVRNAVDHGVEKPDVRLAAGKPERGTLELCAYHANGDVVIEIRDDGAGLDTDRILAKARTKGLIGQSDQPAEQDIHELIFHPGFSTADQVSDVSGRGVGMDVVRQNIRELGGAVEISSVAGQGSTFTIRLPLTLAIVDGQLLRVADHVYIIPLVAILESIQLQDANLRTIADRGQLYRVRGEYVPVFALTDLFDIDLPEAQRTREPLLVLVESGQGKIGLLVDDLLAQQQVVIKSLESNYRPVPGISGATILGDGRVALILDIPGLLRLVRQRGERRRIAPEAETGIRAA
jgi:two-component system, chemotaxis family, sensor kinase CheA